MENEKIKRYNKINGLQNAIYNKINPDKIKIKNVVMQLFPVLWNNTSCYSDETGDNYININQYGDITSLSINKFYWNNKSNIFIEDI